MPQFGITPPMPEWAAPRRQELPSLDSLFNSALNTMLQMQQAKQQKELFNEQMAKAQAARTISIGEMGFDPYAINPQQAQQALGPTPQIGAAPEDANISGLRQYLQQQRRSREAGIVGKEATAIERLAPEKEKAPAGYRFVGGGSLQAISGGPADIKAQEAELKRTSAMESVKREAEDAISAADNALKLAGKTTAGIGAITAQIPGTPGRSLAGYIDTLKATLSFSRLQQMRENSKTGGALGQVSDNELRLLSASVASLDQGQSPEVLRKNLTKILNKYRDIANKMQATGGTEKRLVQSSTQMTPEQRQARIAQLRAKK